LIAQIGEHAAEPLVQGSRSSVDLKGSMAARRQLASAPDILQRRGWASP
jgi:hypothetical protein